MNKQRPSIDGFVPRRTGSQLGELHDNRRPQRTVSPIDRTLHSGDDEGLAKPVGVVRPGQAIGRSDIDESLREIDNNDPAPKKLSRRQRRRLEKQAKPHSKAKRAIKWFFILLLVGAIGVGAYVGIKTFLASNNILKGSIFDIVQSAPLKQDENGRTNILIFGTSEDDPGHDAAYLTDSIIVLSVDQEKKNAYMFSLPRDLEVQYGTACLTGYSGKINVVYGCNYEDGANEGAGAAALQNIVGEVTGMDIQYYAHVNYTVVREAVAAVGGIQIKIESRDPEGQMDSNFDWKCKGGNAYASHATMVKNCPPNGHFIDYPNGVVTLDAEHALYLAQARGDSYPTYGFEQSNFDREKNQQKIIQALREKSLSIGTLTNFGKVTSLIDALGNNLRTNFEKKEIRTLFSLATDIPSTSIQSISLIDGDTPVMNGDGNPKAGQFQYEDIQAYLKKEITSDPFIKEEASIVVLNGSGVAGEGQTFATALEDKGFIVGAVDNAPESTYAAVEVYVIDATKTATLAKIKSLYPSAVIKTTTPPVAVATATKFVIVVGSASQ
jgi:polyisoprenyl-teichoic acid--peptidoglycan teichoic acid transferase